MAQITVQLDDAVATRLVDSARLAGLSDTPNSWSPEVLASFGTSTDFPSQEEFRATLGTDRHRDYI